jgi:hypothetical protein
VKTAGGTGYWSLFAIICLFSVPKGEFPVFSQKNWLPGKQQWVNPGKGKGIQKQRLPERRHIIQR